jgi:hypothetical protein
MGPVLDRGHAIACFERDNDHIAVPPQLGGLASGNARTFTASA